MGKMLRVRIPKLPLVIAIQENMDSIASSFQQQQILNDYNKWEEFEDSLRDYIMKELMTASGRTRVVLNRILDWILKIDEEQDSQIREITNIARYVGHINRLSNKVLKKFDITIERYKPQKNKQMIFSFPIETGVQTFRR